MKGKIVVIDPRGVEWCYWNVRCSKCGNLFYRENPEKCVSPCHRVKWKIIKPIWTTDGFIPSKNEFIQCLKIKETLRKRSEN